MNEYAVDFTCGAIAGLFGIQANSQIYGNFLTTLRTTMKIEGYKGLYKGAWATFMTQFPINALLFSEYGRCYRFLKKQKQLSKQLTYFLSGCYSGLVCLVFICPIEHIKCRQQLEAHNNLTPRQVIQEILRKRGILGIFKGFWATFNRDFISYGVYFWTYYTLKDFYKQRYNKFESHMQLLAGGTAGITSWIVTYPFDTFKTIIQTQNLEEPTIKQIELFKRITQQKGLFYIFNGVQTSLIYAFTLNSAIFMGNEWSHFYLDQYIKS